MLLYDILKKGALVDNQTYQTNNGVLSNWRLGAPIQLDSRKQGKRRNVKNNEEAIWNFMNSVSSDTAKTLQDHKDALVLFNNEEYEHNTDDKLIELTGTDAGNFTLRTGNLIGFIQRGNYTLNIGSRFGNAFLKHIIADADGFLELEDIGGESYTGDYKWLLAYLWNIKLKRAYRLGLPKAYITINERTARVRGTIDAVDYFLNKTSGKYLCSYREHSYDSPATSLLIKAYEAVEHYSFCQRTRNIYNTLLVANKGVQRSRQEILSTPHYTNSFYHDYNVLIDLSKQILTRQGSDFGSQHQSSAFLFDVSMLFEYFIRKLIQRAGIHLQGKSEQPHKIPTGGINKRMHKLKPDLVFEDDNGLYIFDVKYKHFNPRYGVKREDLFQLHTYIGQYANHTPIKGCGFIYPMSEQQWNPLNPDASQGMTIQQQGKDIPFHVLFLKIPDNQHPNFNTLMNQQCRTFINTLQSIISPKEKAAA